MPFPIVYPKSSGDGRLTEVCSFRRSSLSDEEFRNIFDGVMQKIGGFPPSRRSLLGKQVEDPEIAILMVDWTSAAEKDVFEPGEQYQSVKPAFGKLLDASKPDFQCHHLILPGGKTTPDSKYYTVSHLKIPAGKQDEAAAAFEAYLATLDGSEPIDFLALGPSREDADTVVILSGHPDQEGNESMNSTRAHHELNAAVGRLLQGGSKTGFHTVQTWHY